MSHVISHYAPPEGVAAYQQDVLQLGEVSMRREELTAESGEGGVASGRS